MILGTLLTSGLTLSTALLLANTSHCSVIGLCLFAIGPCFEGLSVCFLALNNSSINHEACELLCLRCILREGLLLVHKPRQHIIVHFALERWLHEAHVRECLNGALFQPNQVLFRDDARHMLLVSVLTLLLASFLLVCTPLLLGFEASFSCLETLSFDQLRIANFLVLFLLLLHDRELCLLEDLHASLFKRLHAQDVEHGLNRGIEIEKLSLIIVDLRLFAVLLGGHLGLEEGHRWPVKIELRSDAHLLSRWLVRQVLNIFVRLHGKVLATVHGLRGRDVPVGVHRHYSLRRLYKSSLL